MMNLSSLVREFEMEAVGGGDGGAQNLAILSLADDDEDAAAAFPELPEDVEEDKGTKEKKEEK